MKTYILITKILWISFLGILLSSLSFFPVYSQEKEPAKIGVQISIEVPGFYAGTIKSTMMNKLRSFNDVSIVESGGAYKLVILGMELHSKGGQLAGIVFSIVVLSPENPSLYKLMLSSKGSLNDEQKKLLDEWFQKRNTFDNVSMMVGSYDEITQICEEIVNTFNVDYLEGVRKFLK